MYNFQRRLTSIILLLASSLAGSSSVYALCDGSLTPTQALGPYYTNGSPERNDFIQPGTVGEPLLLSGKVLDTKCQPMAGIKLDFWQTDGDGKYDNQGYRLRGHLFTDAEGRYDLQTVLPGLYPGRPAHIHVVVFSAEGRQLLITQIYFSDNNSGRFHPMLVAQNMPMENDGIRRVKFDFVIDR